MICSNQSFLSFLLLLLLLPYSSLSHHTQTISNYKFESWRATTLHALHKSAQEMRDLCFDLIHLLIRHELLYTNIFGSFIQRTSYWLEAQLTLRILSRKLFSYIHSYNVATGSTTSVVVLSFARGYNS